MFTLEQVVPWGRSFDEYRRMFALTDADLRVKILGCADGPASFNAEAHHDEKPAREGAPYDGGSVASGVCAGQRRSRSRTRPASRAEKRLGSTGGLTPV